MASSANQSAVQLTVGVGAANSERILDAHFLQSYEIFGATLGFWMFLFGIVITIYTIGNIGFSIFEKIRSIKKGGN